MKLLRGITDIQKKIEIIGFEYPNLLLKFQLLSSLNKELFKSSLHFL